MKVIVGLRELVVASLLLNAGILSAERTEVSTTNGEKHGIVGNRFLRVHEEERAGGQGGKLVRIAEQVENSQLRQELENANALGEEMKLVLLAMNGDKAAKTKLYRILKGTSSEEIEAYFKADMETNHVLKEWVEIFKRERNQYSRV
ncbi:hypothetical protein PsorP6_015744 [Peronosclerospora sorghi]|uniref:Uncharacterized protein n=1 Tax=Peronosclerospora sorghi TaxID=230839 RepID=A0ACC0WQ48_9STRA|nr:hypothetical protein PsorP6_015744 [Peronosclerospora sorghi]